MTPLLRFRIRLHRLFILIFFLIPGIADWVLFIKKEFVQLFHDDLALTDLSTYVYSGADYELSSTG